VIYRRLCKHLVNNNILRNKQFGFRANSTTNKAIYRLLDHILMAVNDGHNVGGIFCDLEKAYLLTFIVKFHRSDLGYKIRLTDIEPVTDSNNKYTCLKI
jgi:hypothetical protein